MGLKASSNKLCDVRHEMFTQKAESICATAQKVVMTKQDEDPKPWTMREEAPAHYRLEIESFDMLSQIVSKSRLGRYESDEFEASGYKWMLILYPNGDKERKGADHISLYLRLVDSCTKKLGRAWEIDALVSFFVLHQRKNQYMWIQDGRVKRFNAVKQECGFPRLIPLTEFNDPSKGYLSEKHSCKFGVEVFVLKSEGKGECFSTLEYRSKNYYKWVIENFSKIPESGQYSKEFSVGDYKWKLHLYPKGVAKVKEEYLSIFLCRQEPINHSSGRTMHVEFKLRLNAQSGENKAEKQGNAWFSTANPAWGFPFFVKLAELNRIKDFTVLAEAEISSMSMTNDLSPDPPDTMIKPEDNDWPPI